MPSKKQTIHAVHDMDLDSILENLGLLDSLESGNLRCNMCNNSINRENLAYLYAEDDEIKVCCTSLDCFKRLSLQRRSIHG